MSVILKMAYMVESQAGGRGTRLGLDLHELGGRRDFQSDLFVQEGKGVLSLLNLSWRLGG